MVNFFHIVATLCRTYPLRLLLVVVVVGAVAWQLSSTLQTPEKLGERPQPVRLAVAGKADIPVFLQAIGTVVPTNTVLVKSRVDGPLETILFTEGQLVQEGQVLATIDPNPYRVRLDQAKGTYAKNLAQLQGAQVDLERYRKLIKEGSVPVQQLQAQEALVGQYKGTLQVDAANIADAELQLSYTRIVAPISGRVGLKKVDKGNMIRAADAAGIVVITQTEPMLLTFSIVERDVPQVLAAKAQSELLVEAWGQGSSLLLATGQLASLDNQIDTATGTVKAKASFDRAGNTLFPNQFVNVRLLLRTERDALVVPTSAVQRDNDGFFVFALQAPETSSSGASSEQATPATQNATGAAFVPAAESAANTSGSASKGNKRAGMQGAGSPPVRATGVVVPRKIRTGYSTGTQTIVLEGIAEGDKVVVDGIDRLRDGSAVVY